MGKKNKGMTAFLLPLNKECLLNRLTDEEVGRLFRHLYAYANRNELPEETENSSILVAFDCFTAYINEAKTAYEKKVNDGKKAIQKRWGKDAEEHQSIGTYTDLPSPIPKDSNLYQRIGEDTKTKTKTILSERETPPTPSEGDGSPSPVEKFLGYLEKEGFDNLLKLVPPTDEQVLWFKANYETKYVTEACRRLDNWPLLPQKKRKMFDTIKRELEVMNSEGLIYHGENR